MLKQLLGWLKNNLILIVILSLIAFFAWYTYHKLEAKIRDLNKHNNSLRRQLENGVISAMPDSSVERLRYNERTGEQSDLSEDTALPETDENIRQETQDKLAQYEYAVDEQPVATVGMAIFGVQPEGEGRIEEEKDADLDNVKEEGESANDNVKGEHSLKSADIQIQVGDNVKQEEESDEELPSDINFDDDIDSFHDGQSLSYTSYIDSEIKDMLDTPASRAQVDDERELEEQERQEQERREQERREQERQQREEQEYILSSNRGKKRAMQLKLQKEREQMEKERENSEKPKPKLNKGVKLKGGIKNSTIKKAPSDRLQKLGTN